MSHRRRHNFSNYWINIIVGLVLIFGVSRFLDYLQCGTKLPQNIEWGINVCHTIALVNGWLGIINLAVVIIGAVLIVKGIIRLIRNRKRRY